jgi:hypothetical protein
MRVSPAAPALIGTALCLVLSACSKPQVAVRPPPPRMAASSIDGAEKLQRLNIMLMVTALRCRRTGDDFTADYRRFAAEQAGPLQQASAQLRSKLGVRHGARAGRAMFDRLSTSMANSYGQGHPWLNCRQLKQVARNLANVEGSPTLVEAADQLLARRGSPQMALAKR